MPKLRHSERPYKSTSRYREQFLDAKAKKYQNRPSVT